MKKFEILLAFALIASSCVTRITCVGDSITEGYGLKMQSQTSYPFVMNKLLGQKYKVINLGRSSATLQKRGNFPYWNCKEFSDAFAFQPHILVIMLGTNDSKPENWNQNQFLNDFQCMIDTFETIRPKPKIVICKPVPAFGNNWGIRDSIIANVILPIIDTIAAKNHLRSIDLYYPLKKQKKNFPDLIHPNETASAEIATIIVSAILKK